jgi:hypothetical protein
MGKGREGIRGTDRLNAAGAAAKRGAFRAGLNSVPATIT